MECVIKVNLFLIHILNQNKQLPSRSLSSSVSLLDSLINLLVGFRFRESSSLSRLEVSSAFYRNFLAMSYTGKTYSHEFAWNSCEFHANSTHEKETKNKHTNIARRKHTIFMRILHDLCDFYTIIMWNYFYMIFMRKMIFMNLPFIMWLSHNYCINITRFQWSSRYWKIFSEKSSYSSKSENQLGRMKNAALLRMYQSLI